MLKTCYLDSGTLTPARTSGRVEGASTVEDLLEVLAAP